MSFLTVLLGSMLPVVVPAVIGITKGLVPKVPKVLYPLAAAGLGVASTVLTGLDYGQSALLGLAGVGVREVVDQTRKMFEL